MLPEGFEMPMLHALFGLWLSFAGASI